MGGSLLMVSPLITRAHCSSVLVVYFLWTNIIARHQCKKGMKYK